MDKTMTCLSALAGLSLLTSESFGATLALTVQPIRLQADNGDLAPMRIDEFRLNRAYSAADIEITFLPTLILQSEDGFFGDIAPDQYVNVAINAGLSVDANDNVPELFFVEFVPITGADVGGLALTPGDEAFVALGISQGTGDAAAEDAFAIGHELAHNLGLDHTNAVDNTIMGGGPFENRTSAETAFNANQIAIVQQSPLLVSIPEPSSAFLALLGGVSLLGRRRKS